MIKHLNQMQKIDNLIFYFKLINKKYQNGKINIKILYLNKRKKLKN